MNQTKTKNRAEIIFASNKNVILEEGDLFEQEGLKVIQVHCTFDMNDQMVSSRSVWGQFIAKCKNEDFDLEKAIEKQIELKKDQATYDESKPFNKYLFSRGTVLRIKNNKKEEFAITAFNDVNPQGSIVHMSYNWYIDYMDKLWESLANAGVNTSVINVPLIGNNIVSVGGQNTSLDIETQVAIIAWSYLKAARRQGTFRTLRICVHPSQAQHIKFTQWGKSLLPFINKLSEQPLGLRELNSSNQGLFAGVLPREVTNKQKEEKKWLYDVFISKNQKDYEHAADLKTWLEKHNYKAFESEYDLRENGNADYWDEINKCLDGSEWFLLLLSKNECGNNSKVTWEWQRFLSDYTIGKRKGSPKILGLIIDDTPIANIIPEIRAFECLYLGTDQERILNFISKKD